MITFFSFLVWILYQIFFARIIFWSSLKYTNFDSRYLCNLVASVSSFLLSLVSLVAGIKLMQRNKATDAIATGLFTELISPPPLKIIAYSPFNSIFFENPRIRVGGWSIVISTSLSMYNIFFILKHFCTSKSIIEIFLQLSYHAWFKISFYCICKLYLENLIIWS